MNKGIITINIFALILALLSALFIYSSHTNLAVTKDSHLHNQRIIEMNKITELSEIKKSYIEFIKINKINNESHNNETKQLILLILGVILLLIINILLLVNLNMRNKNAT